MSCEFDGAMMPGQTPLYSPDQPDRLPSYSHTPDTYCGKSIVGNFSAGRSGDERDLRTRHNRAYGQRRTILGRAPYSSASTSPSCFLITTVATGSNGNHHTVRWLGPGPLDGLQASSRLLGGAVYRNISPWLSAAHLAAQAPTFTSTLQSFSAIRTAGSHFIYDHLTKLASWATLGLSTIGIPKHSAGSGHSETTAGPSKLAERGSSHHARSHKTTTKKKRAHSGNSHSEDNNSDEHRAKSKSKRRREAEGPRLHLACPFAKKDPVRWRACYRHELSKISYVKQHLYRVHLQPLYCLRCGTTFEQQEDLSDHLTSSTACEVRPFTTPEGLTMEQRQRLSERLSSKLSDEERWYAVFDIVFPGHPHPATPYVDPDTSEDLASFRDHMVRHGPQILVDEYRRRVDGTPPSALETAMRSGLEQISSSWLSLRSPYVHHHHQQQQQQQQQQISSPRRRRSPVSATASQVDLDKTGEDD